MSTKTRETITPLNGDWVYSLKIPRVNGERKLARRWHAMEFGVYERVLACVHTDYPGIRVIDLFQAPADKEGLPVDLDSAKLHNPKSIRFLLSVASGERAVVTSQMGYDVSGEYSLDQRDYAPKLPDHLDMFDVSRHDSHARVTRTHIRRLGAFGMHPDAAIPQDEADNTFRAITKNTVEVH